MHSLILLVMADYDVLYTLAPKHFNAFEFSLSLA